jgi:hypothetical protein
MAVGEFAIPATSGAGSTPASTTPTLSVATAAFGTVTATISNYASYTNPNFSASAAVGGTTTVTDANVDHSLSASLEKLSDKLFIKDTNATAGTRTLSVRAQEFGDYKQSAVATATYDVSYVTARYIRLRIVTSAGAATTSYAGIADIRFYTSVSQGGTAYPTTQLTSNTSETGIAVSAGYSYSATYDPWKAADNPAIGTFWWSLGISNSALNWWQIEFQPGTYPTPPTIKSMRLSSSNFQATHFQLLSSSTGAFAGEETNHGIFEVTNQNGTNNYG